MPPPDARGGFAIAPLQVAFFGECMLEVQARGFGPACLAFGGDTLNAATYLRRCAPAAQLNVCYATALGDDPLSAAMLSAWALEGLDTSAVLRLPGRLPGLYLIETDPQGERRFHFWREQAAARAYFDVPLTPLEARADAWDALYVSGISLAILPPAARQRLLALMRRVRDRGGVVAFDNNYRPRLWPDARVAQQAFAQACEVCTLALITADDHAAVHRLQDPEATLAHARQLDVPEVVIKCGPQPTWVRAAGEVHWHPVPTEPVAAVVDTTAAGDSFAGAYLSRRLLGASALQAAAFGNRVAARVIQHPGALVPREAMADLLPA